MPIQYTEVEQLQKHVQIPCTVDMNSKDEMCNLYKYIDLDKEGFMKFEAEKTRNKQPPLFNDTSITSKLEFNAMVLISPDYVCKT